MKPLYLNGSGSVMQYPNDDVDTDTLKCILEDAVEHKIPKSARIVIIKHERVIKSDPEYGYTNRERIVRLLELFQMYESIFSKKFSPSKAGFVGRDL